MITLKKSNGNKFDGAVRYFHNNININEWKKSSITDSTQKVALRLIELYLSAAERGVAPDKRVYIQNTALRTERDQDGNVLYSYKNITVQRAIRYLMDMKVIDHVYYLDTENNKYVWNGGTKDKWQSEYAGLTNRYIVLNIKRAKELFTIKHTSKTYVEADARGRLRRLVARRPFTLKEVGIALEEQALKDRNDKVETIRQSKNRGYDSYLALQLKRYGNFSDVEKVVIVESLDITTPPNILQLCHNFIYKEPLTKGIDKLN